MSRYVTKKHGLVIGSGNVFFYRDDEDVFHDGFAAVVWAQGAYFPNHSTAHSGVRTLAEQFLWEEWMAKAEPTEFEGITLPMLKHQRVLRPYPRYWLDNNAPGYGTSRKDCGGHGSIFFTKRGHALAFVRKVEEMLSGMEYV